MTHKVYLSLGANIGDRHAGIAAALELLGETVGRGFESENKFLNMCVALETDLSPHQLLVATQDIERRLGRKTKSAGGVYADRLIDIDILLYDDISVSTPELTVPHPHMRERDFVMRPLMEIMDGNG